MRDSSLEQMRLLLARAGALSAASDIVFRSSVTPVRSFLDIGADYDEDGNLTAGRHHLSELGLTADVAADPFAELSAVLAWYVKMEALDAEQSRALALLFQSSPSSRSVADRLVRDGADLSPEPLSAAVGSMAALDRFWARTHGDIMGTPIYDLPDETVGTPIAEMLALIHGAVAHA